MLKTSEVKMDGVLMWNPEYIITKNDSTESHIVRCPVQNTRLANFRHFKVLTRYDMKLDLDRLDKWGLYKYCDSTKTVKQVCDIITTLNQGVTEAAVMEKIEKMVHIGFITLV